MNLRILLLSTLLLACGKGDKGTSPGDTDDTDDTDDVVLPGDYDDSWVDTLPEALRDPPEQVHGGVGFDFDPDLRDPVTAYADCGAWLSTCLRESEGDFDGCVDQVPICQTEAPWDEGDCCPQACQAAYQQAVAGGTESFEAYARTFAIERTCFDGLTRGEL